MIIGILGGSFLEPDPLSWLFGAGIGTNIGSSIIWGFLAGLIGVFAARRIKRAWAGLHVRLSDLHDRHDHHHQQLRSLERSIAGLHARLDERKH